MLQHYPIPCAIVDIETTGGNVTYDRITEIAIIEVTKDGVTEWSTLINPRVHIPKSIQSLTGITDEMVATAPYFEQVAKEILLRLQGKLFIAHNVRFDYGFIRNEYARLAYSFKAKLLCTVKLSRFLYADRAGHSLEKIIARHQIYVAARHRALDDARATYKFMSIAEEEKGEHQVKQAIQHQYRKESMPAHFDACLVDELPNHSGVYYFWGENRELLYIGKSINIRKRVLGHFTADHKSSREMKICQQTRNITFEKTPGELSALLLESKKVKELQPLYNRRLRRVSTFYSVCLVKQQDGLLNPNILPISELPQANQKRYGLFRSAKQAKEAIQGICDSHGLCYQACGLEPFSKRACSSHQLKKCRGYCAGKLPALQHNVKLLESLSSLALTSWPYPGPVALVEGSGNDYYQYLLIDNWCVLATANSMEELLENARRKTQPEIDKDIYRYLRSAILTPSKTIKIFPLQSIRPLSQPLEATDIE